MLEHIIPKRLVFFPPLPSGVLSSLRLFRRRADAKAVSEIDPSSRSAKDSVARLEKLHHEKNEKMKEEAIGEFWWRMSTPLLKLHLERLRR